VPAQKRIRLDEHEGIAPEREHRREGHQQGAFRGAKLRLLDASGGNQELLAKEGVLRDKLPPGAYEVREEPPVTPQGLGVSMRAARRARRPATVMLRRSRAMSKPTGPNTSHLCPITRAETSLRPRVG